MRIEGAPEGAEITCRFLTHPSRFWATMKATTAGANSASGSGSIAAAPAASGSGSASIPSGSGQQSRSSRIAPHSHIRGLGLDNTSGLVASAAGLNGGFVGQDLAREVSANCASSNSATDAFSYLREEVNHQYRCDYFKWAVDVRREQNLKQKSDIASSGS